MSLKAGNSSCTVCLLENRENLLLVSEKDSQNVSWSNKLSFCVSEVQWEETWLICEQCTRQLDQTFEFRTMCLKNHLQVFYCYHCNESFNDKTLLIDHLRLKHFEIGGSSNSSGFGDDSTIKSQIIVQGFKDDSSDNDSTDLPSVEITPKKSSKTSSNNKNHVKLKCDKCDSVFHTKYLLNRHKRNVHATEKLFGCDICGQRFASPVYLAAHNRYHVGERSHICTFCGKGFITASDLYHHEKTHANRRDYKCSECPKAFNTSSDLHKHRICVHQDRNLWKYICAFCNKRFPLKTNLDTHTKTHTGEKNFQCHLCERKCINKSVLQRHIESHSNVRSFKCSVCHQDYKYQKSLDIHLAKAHGLGNAKIPTKEKRYFCHMCPKSYFANNKLEKHIRSHTGEKPFACPLCDKRFTDKSYVKVHISTAHKQNL